MRNVRDRWARLSVTFHDDPKVLRAGNAAAGLYARSLSYCMDHETDGWIPRDFVTARERCLARTLVREKLWERARGGWTVHAFLDWQESSRDLRRSREMAAERQRRHRAVTRDNGMTGGVVTGDSRATSSSYSSSSSLSTSARETTERRDSLGSGGDELERRNREYLRRTHGL